MMSKGTLLYEGKAKRLYDTDDPDLVWVEFKDDATAFNGKKKGTIRDKGSFNNRISERFFQWVADAGVKTHFVKTLSDRDMLVRKVTIVPLEVVVRNVAAGSLAHRLGLEEGTGLAFPVVEFYYKNDDLGDPLLNRWHIRVLEIIAESDLDRLERAALRVNAILKPRLWDRGINLIDFKLEFGFSDQGELLLADEISPDTCRFWDRSTGDKMDKDRFRRDLGQVEEAYAEVWRRISDIGA